MAHAICNSASSALSLFAALVLFGKADESRILLTHSIEVTDSMHGTGSAIGESQSLPTMLETIAIVLVVLWLLGLVSSYTMGGFIHVLLVLALIMIVLRVIRGNRPIS
jgi:hypothetical protein